MPDNPIPNTDLASMTSEELEAFFLSIGEPKYRARQVFSALAAGRRLSEITTLPKALRERLAAASPDRTPAVAQKLVSKLDGTIKYLFRRQPPDRYGQPRFELL